MDQYMITINKSFLLLYFFNGLIKNKKGVLAWPLAKKFRIVNESEYDVRVSQ